MVTIHRISSLRTTCFTNTVIVGEHMRASRQIVSISKNLLVVATAFTLVFPASLFAQDAPSAPSAAKTTTAQPDGQKRTLVDFTKPQLHFPNPLSPYTPRQLSEPGFSN